MEGRSLQLGPWDYASSYIQIYMATSHPRRNQPCPRPHTTSLRTSSGEAQSVCSWGSFTLTILQRWEATSSRNSGEMWPVFNNWLSLGVAAFRWRQAIFLLRAQLLCLFTMRYYMGIYYAYLLTILYGNIRHKEPHHTGTPVTCLPLCTTAPSSVSQLLRSLGANRCFHCGLNYHAYSLNILYGNIRCSLLRQPCSYTARCCGYIINPYFLY